MRSRLWYLIPGLVIMIVASPAPMSARPCNSVSLYDLGNWFSSQVWLTPVIGVIAGGLIGAFLLARLHYRPGELSADGRARRNFVLWLVLVVVCTGIYLLLEAWLVFIPPSSNIRLDLSGAFWCVWMTSSTVKLLVFGAVGYVIAAGLATRLAHGSRCRYALTPGPKVP